MDTQRGPYTGSGRPVAHVAEGPRVRREEEGEGRREKDEEASGMAGRREREGGGERARAGERERPCYI